MLHQAIPNHLRFAPGHSQMQCCFRMSVSQYFSACLWQQNMTKIVAPIWFWQDMTRLCGFFCNVRQGSRVPVPGGARCVLILLSPAFDRRKLQKCLVPWGTSTARRDAQRVLLAVVRWKDRDRGVKSPNNKQTVRQFLVFPVSLFFMGVMVSLHTSWNNVSIHRTMNLSRGLWSSFLSFLDLLSFALSFTLSPCFCCWCLQQLHGLPRANAWKLLYETVRVQEVHMGASISSISSILFNMFVSFCFPFQDV